MKCTVCMHPPSPIKIIMTAGWADKLGKQLWHVSQTKHNQRDISTIKEFFSQTHLACSAWHMSTAKRHQRAFQTAFQLTAKVCAMSECSTFINPVFFFFLLVLVPDRWEDLLRPNAGTWQWKLQSTDSLALTLGGSERTTLGLRLYQLMHWQVVVIKVSLFWKGITWWTWKYLTKDSFLFFLSSFLCRQIHNT